MGHQFGARHSFNGTTGGCSIGRDPVSAYEPGGGSTIMAYAGLCGTESLQQYKDPNFHAVSFDEIVGITSGIACGTKTPTGNTAPVPAAGPPIIIPASTPFFLTGSATDADGDALTYSWEQFDLGTMSPPNTDYGNRPIFRSFAPVATPVRTFPRLQDLLANTTTLGESLPTTMRTMMFRFTARDNRMGINTSSTTVSVTSAAGPFVVTAPNTNVSWTGGSTQNVTWDVAGTTATPVRCANVKILLSTDGGNTFAVTVLASTPNDGAQPVTVPAISTSAARIRVECATSPFFDISNVDFTIAAPLTVTRAGT
jgi:Metallo-peptidase family M12